MRKSVVVLSLGAGVVVAVLCGVVGAAMYMTCMPGPAHRGPLAAATELQQERAERLRGHVGVLAGRLGERNQHHAVQLLAASDYIEEVWRLQGHDVRRECFEVDGATVCNLTVRVGAGTADPVVVGAHYDTAWGTPGADDNASGVSVLLEISRELDPPSLRRPVWLVAYANEEPPWFRTRHMGSAVHARRMAERGERPFVMYSLEMLGYFDDAPGSQEYPVPALGWLYGDRGDYVAFVGNVASVARVRSSVDAFRRGVRFPSMGAALPELIPGLDYSDHLNYWEHGWPAVMVTDTSFHRNPAYHEAEDVPESLDYDRMSRVTEGLVAVVRDAARSR